MKVSGRVGPVGIFSNCEDNIEYFWGLAHISLGHTPIAVTQTDITQFTSDCPEVTASSVEFRIGFKNGLTMAKSLLTKR
jgi:hypothetical protein